MCAKNCFYFLSLLINTEILAQIKGFVYEKNTQTPISGVWVFEKKNGKTTQTDAKGYFILETPLKAGDTIFFSKINFSNSYVVFKPQIDTLKIELENYEKIEEIEVSIPKFRHRRKVGDLRTPFTGILGIGANTNLFVQGSNPIVSYIPNKTAKKGQITKVYVKFTTRTIKFLEKSITSNQLQKRALKNPEYIKIKVLCYSVDEHKRPFQPLVEKEMLFFIRDFKPQWLDISMFQVPFPENGAFVGMQVIEVKGEEGWGNVYVPLLYTKNENSDMFYLANGMWLLQGNKGSVMGKDKYYTYGFGAEIAY
jgi:hypothetical protein